MHRRLVTWLLLLGVFSSHSQDKIIVNDVDWPPYFFINADQQPQQNELTLKGIGKEIINICTANAGYTPQYQRLPIKRTHQFMQHGTIDLTVYSHKKNREAFLYYAKEPIFSTEYVFIVKADSPISINRLSDLQPLKIGYLLGLTYTPELMTIINDKEKTDDAIMANNWEAMFAQLLAPTPRFDTMADSKNSMYWRAKILGVSEQIKIIDYSIKKKDYFITVSKQSANIKDGKKFLTKMDYCLRTLKSNGQYQAILAKYGIR